MQSKVYALLAGVNDYTPNVGKLDGCLNDVDHYQSFLESHFDPQQLRLRVLKNSQATRQGIIDGFRQHLAQAQADDVVLFQFAGHGARWKSAPEFHKFYADGYDEGLVCWDSRREPARPGSYDFADKELAVLIAEVAQSGAHVTVILDCCHSGSGTRSTPPVLYKPRMTHQIDTARPLDSYLSGHYAKQLQTSGRLEMPASRHILLAACERQKQAFEADDQRGIFSSTLLNALETCDGKTNYADLFVRIRAIVRRKAINQTPQFEAFRGFNGREGFLGIETPRSSTSTRFLVNYELYEGSWAVECGAIQGLTAEENRPLEFAIFERASPDTSVTPDAKAAASQSPEVPLGTAHATSIGLAKSKLQLNFEPDPTKTFFAEVTSIPAPPFVVGLCGEPEGTTCLQQYIQSEDFVGNIELSEDRSARFKFTIEAQTLPDEGPCLLIYETESRRLIQGVIGFNRAAAKFIGKLLVQLETWESTRTLQNQSNLPSATRVPFKLVTVDQQGNDVEHEGSTVRLNLSGPDDIVTGKLLTRNATSQPLYSMLVYLSDDYGMYVLDNDEFPASKQWRNILLDGDPEMELFLDDEGPRHTVERFMLIVSKERIDEFLLGPIAQRNDNESTSEVLKPIELGKIVQPTQGRSTRFGRQKIKDIDWFTQTIEIELVRHLGSTSQSDTRLAEGKVTIQGHSAFQADVTLNGLAPIGRGAGDGLDDDESLCRMLQANGLSLVNFSAARGGSLTTLELSPRAGLDSLAKEPLKLVVEQPLAEHEFLLPVTFDGAVVLPVGEAVKSQDGKTTISIDQWPEKSTKERSVFSTLKLFFFKTYLRQPTVNRLRWAEFTADGQVLLSTRDLAGRVAASERIVLLLPGLFGDGRHSAEQFRAELARNKGGSLFSADSESLVLCYDYEQLNTGLDRTAGELKTALAAIGIGPGCEKEVTVVGESIGGLVARWLIEREQGNEFVHRLVMLGTPNGGAPIGKIGLAKKCAQLLTTLAINTYPPAAAIGGMVLSYLVQLNSLTVTMEQLDAASDFMSKLNSDDSAPGVDYTVVAGDVSSLSAEDAAGWLNSLGQSSLAHLLFDGDAHDLMVSRNSVFGLQRAAGEAAWELDVPSHHFGYWPSLSSVHSREH